MRRWLLRKRGFRSLRWSLWCGGCNPCLDAKSVLYFTAGMYLTPELDAIFRNLTSMANRANVTFYAVDTRGVMTFAQNAGATDQLGRANAASSTSTLQEGNATQAEMRSSDDAETSSRANKQLPIRNLAEATGGFLLGESNDLRTPLRHVNEEIAKLLRANL